MTLICLSGKGRESIVNQVLTRFAHTCADRTSQCTSDEARMQRLRLKADGRIVELRDGQEFPLAPVMAVIEPSAATTVPAEAGMPAVRDLRRRASLTQMEFASRLGVPVETIRNWEQGKRMPR